jgi:hypothetical protein
LDLWLFGPIKRIFNDAHKLFEAVIEFWMRFSHLNCGLLSALDRMSEKGLSH